MSDPILKSLNAALDLYTARRNDAQRSVDTLTRTIAELYPDPPPTAPEKKVVGKKAKVQKIFKKGANATNLTEQQIVDAAIGVIRKSGPLGLTALAKGIKKVYPKMKERVGPVLRREEKKTGGRLMRQSGKWTESAQYKRVKDARSPEEVAAAFATAKKNEEREVEAA